MRYLLIPLLLNLAIHPTLSPAQVPGEPRRVDLDGQPGRKEKKVDGDGRILGEDSFGTGVIAFGPVGKRILTGGVDGMFIVQIDPDSLDGSGRPPRSVIFWGKPPQLREWDAATGLQIRSYTNVSAPIVAAAFSADASLVASSEVGAFVPVYKEFRENKVDRRPDPRGDIGTGSGHSLDTEWSGGLVRVFDAETGRQVRVLDRTESPIFAVAIGPTFLTGVDGIGKIHVWDRESGRKLSTFRIQKREGFDVLAEISPDGRRVAFPSAAGIQVWNIGGTVRDIRVRGYIRGAAFAAEVHKLAVCAEEFGPGDKIQRRVEIWDPDRGQLLREIEISMDAEEFQVFSGLAFSPDGSRLAIGCTAGEVQVVDLSSGRVIDRFRVPGRKIRAIHFGPKALRVVSAKDEFGHGPLQVRDFPVD